MQVRDELGTRATTKELVIDSREAAHCNLKQHTMGTDERENARSVVRLLWEHMIAQRLACRSLHAILCVPAASTNRVHLQA